MKIFLNKLLLSTKSKKVTWEYLEKFDALLGFHTDYDVTITRRDLSTPRFSVIVNTSDGGCARFETTSESSLYFLLVVIRKAAINTATVISI